MKFLTIVGVLAAAVAASPIALPESQGIDLSDFAGPVDERDAGIQFGEPESALDKRQSVGTTATELENGPCRRITFIFARGSTEPGNLVSTQSNTFQRCCVRFCRCQDLTLFRALQLDQQLVTSSSLHTDRAMSHAKVLAAHTQQVWPQTLFLRERLLGPSQKLSACSTWPIPNARIRSSQVVDTGKPSSHRLQRLSRKLTGNSQGGAVIHGAVPGLSSTVRSKIRALVYYGDSRQQQTGGQTGGIPSSNVLEICNTGDPICRGTLIVNAAHLTYVPTVPRAVSFIRSRVGS